MESIKDIYETYTKVFAKGNAVPLTSAIQVSIVDDDSTFTQMLSDFLNEHGIHAISFRSGEEFLSNMPADENQIVIMDYYFDGAQSIDGLDVLKQIKKRSPNIPVIFLSANDNLDTALETLRNGALDYFVKTNKTVFAQILSTIIKIDRMKKSSLN